ncbi:MAG: nucleotidyltransferase family protein [Thermodesulfovibrionales bacterium]
MSSLFLKLIRPLPLTDTEFTGEDLSVVKSLGIRHNLFPLVYACLQNLGNSIENRKGVDDFLKETERLYLKSVSRSVRQEAVENEVTSLLLQKGIRSMVIKGNRLANEIFQDPNCRVSSDIDILIPRFDAEKVDRILREQGYQGDAVAPVKYCLSRIHHAIYRHPGNNMLVEIHWHFGVPYFFRLTSDEIWREVKANDSGAMMLSPEMTLVMLLIHHHSHSFRELKILVDILWTLYRYENVIDWRHFAMKIRKAGLVKTTLISLHQIKTLWKEAPYDLKSFRALERGINNTGYSIPSIVLSYFRMDIHKDKAQNIYKDKLIARFALDSRSDILLSFPKTLFPVPEAIRELYRDGRNWTLPLNYLKFITWRVKEWMGKSCT